MSKKEVSRGPRLDDFVLPDLSAEGAEHARFEQ